MRDIPIIPCDNRFLVENPVSKDSTILNDLEVIDESVDRAKVAQRCTKLVTLDGH